VHRIGCRPAPSLLSRSIRAIPNPRHALPGIAPPPKVLLNPKMADVYRSKLADLHAALDDP
jgi:hypothetical protein